MRMLIPAGVLGLMFGCGGVQTDYSRLELIQVGGTVTLEGAPLADAMVVFEAEDRTMSFGRTDASGHYHLQFNSEERGVLPGRKTVRISTQGGVGEDADSGEEEDPDSQPEKNASEVVPECYNVKSALTVEVTSGTSTLDFNLKLDCSTAGPG